jgi:hypothetical protein
VPELLCCVYISQFVCFCIDKSETKAICDFCLCGLQISTDVYKQKERFGFVTEMQYSNESNVLGMS